MLRWRPHLALIFALAALIGLVNAAVLRGGHRLAAARAAPAADCALVLGNAVHDDGTPGAVLSERLEEALALYRSGHAPRILVSGDQRYREPAAMRRWLEDRGVPASAITVDPSSVDTYSSVWRARHVFGVSRPLIVTQRFHLPRALWVARQVGMEAEGAPADRAADRAAVWLEVREVLSRTKAFFDVAIDRVPAARPPSLV